MTKRPDYPCKREWKLRELEEAGHTRKTCEKVGIVGKLAETGKLVRNFIGNVTRTHVAK